MGSMKSATRTQLPSTEQLTLLPATSTPARFRLSKDTRERGLRHVAEIRQMLAARSDSAVVALPQHDQAA
jgi:hypothetical protein